MLWRLSCDTALETLQSSFHQRITQVRFFAGWQDGSKVVLAGSKVGVAQLAAVQLNKLQSHKL
jgi:nucleoside phosphorylase